MKRLVHAIAGPVGRLRVFAALTIGSAAAISFDSIRHLAQVAGFGPLAWLFPLTLDAVAAYGMDLWVRRSPAWKQARALALAAILGSLVANVVDHYLTQHAVLGAVLGAVPPAMLAALLATAHRHGAGTARTDRAPVAIHPWPDHGEPIGPQTYLDAVREAQGELWGRISVAGPDECWPWLTRTGEVATDYGRFRIGGVWQTGHRVAFAIANGYFPGPGRVVRHLCDNPPCCNPRHLADGTPKENAEDRVQRMTREREPETPKRAAAVKPRTSPRLRVVAGKPRQANQDDRQAIAWIRGQEKVTKRQVMTQFGIGSSRSLRLMAEARKDQERAASDG